MPKPYRRRKGKSGPYVGNYRCTVDGRDINLQTKDAHEALARSRLAGKGKWPPIPAAVEAARAALSGTTDPEPPPPAGEAEDTGGGEPHAESPTPATHSPPPREQPSHEPPPDLNEAARAAAAEASGLGSGPDPEVQAEQENHVNAELAAVMAELSGGASGGDLLDGICDGVAAGLLWCEGKAIELGINWTLARRKSNQRLQTEQLPRDALMRKALRCGLKGMAVVHFPDFTTRLTPGWAIAIGMIGGAAQTLQTAQLVDKKTGAAVSVAEAVTQAQAAAAEQPSPPQTPPAS